MSIIKFISDAFMVPRKKRNEAEKAFAKAIIEHYKLKSVKEMQDAFKDILAQCLRQCFSVK